MELLERFRSRYPFPLDDFQVEAIRAIEAGQSVIVSAPTGAGKTLVAEFAIHAALAAGRRLAYTTPLKALSNQKFADFTREFGADRVGILTGDVKVNPHAAILVMTTEILRNALYGSGLDGLRYIVLDECHYMGDEGRGTVWEEIIVSAPPDVVLVGLSATVANVKEIADWISIVHRPIVPIYHPHRPVPLAYVIADLAGEIHEVDRVRSGRARVVGHGPRGPDHRRPWYTRRVVHPTVLLEALEARGWLPTIYFIFSRVGCERAMQDVLTEGKSLLAPPQQREVDTAIGELIRESPTVAESVLNQSVFEFFFSSRRRHTRLQGDWSSDVCSSDLDEVGDLLRLSDSAQRDLLRIFGHRDRERFPFAFRSDLGDLGKAVRRDPSWSHGVQDRKSVV